VEARNYSAGVAKGVMIEVRTGSKACNERRGVQAGALNKGVQGIDG